MTLKNKVVPALVLALGLVVTWEGYNPKVYLDPVGIPTVCYGHVVNHEVPVGTVFSREACHQILYSDLKIASDGFDRFVSVEVQPYQKAAFISFILNTGLGNFHKSTMLKLINANRIVAACHELPKWIYATKKDGHKVKLKGLVNRRQAEMELCLSGQFVS